MSQRIGLSSLLSVVLFSPLVLAISSNFPSPQNRNLWALNKAAFSPAVETTNFADEFPPQWFEQPLDHFDSSNANTFNQRYWFSTRHYTAGSGGPVIVLDGGETSGEDRLTYLDTGIVDILTRSLGGIGVILEHRYYGESIATDNLTTDSLRWLDNDQAAADSANFMQNIQFPNIDEDLTAPGTPWIYYGGSYAGARSAHMKILYPDIVFGSIASSGVTHATLDNWRYFDIVRQFANATCSAELQNFAQAIDSIIATDLVDKVGPQLKDLFGLKDLEHYDDFASVLSFPIGDWQSKCWNDECGDDSFDQFCAALDVPPAQGLDQLVVNDEKRLLPFTDDISFDYSVFNYAEYIKNGTVAQCGGSIEDCFGTYNDSQYQDTGLDQDWRLWDFQVCTQWGYFSGAPPDPDTPRVVSSLLTVEYNSKFCQQAYLPGEFFQIPAKPNVTSVNVLGDFDIAADRLAIIDGQFDVWRPDTPHADEAKPREDTIIRPFKLIPAAVHHWDESGLANIDDEPADIKQIHEEMIDFVGQWLEDFKSS